MNSEKKEKFKYRWVLLMMSCITVVNYIYNLEYYSFLFR